MKITTLFLLILLSPNLWSQSNRLPEVPKEYAWNTTAEYQAEQENIEKCLKWLCNNPLGDSIALRSEVNAYVMQWLAGAPFMELVVDSKSIPFIEEHEELLFTYIHGKAFYLLKHLNEKDQDKLHMKGLEIVCSLAQQSDELSQSKALRPMLRAYRRGQLKNFVKEQKGG